MVIAVLTTCLLVLWVWSHESNNKNMRKIPDRAERRAMLEDAEEDEKDWYAALDSAEEDEKHWCPHHPRCDNYEDCQLTRQIEEAVELQNEREAKKVLSA